MTEFLLIRHAINDWVNTGRLAGWTPGVHLNQEGKAQAVALGERLARSQLTAIYSSPLERTMETADAIAAHYPGLTAQPLADIGEVRYGEWQGAKLSHLRRDKLWEIVQNYPSRARFPGGEAIRQAQARAVDALETLATQHPNGRVVAVSHSDVIKLIVAHYLGAHLDLFQRIAISPASITMIYLGSGRPTIGCVNDTSHLPPPPPLARQLGPWERMRHRLARRR
jgi:probable phosphoglycerate mutase